VTRADDWASVELGSVATVSWGDTATTKAAYVDEGYPAYSATGRDGFLPYADHDLPGVVLSAIGANCGKTWLATGRWSCIKNTMWFRSGDPDVLTEYLYYATADPSRWPRRGAAQPFIALADARRVEVLLPPIGTQRSVVGILSAYDELTETNARRIRVLDEMTQAIYREWFVEFRFPGHEDVRLIPSELGSIPEGWQTAKLGEYAESLVDGDWIESKDQSGSDYRLLQVSNIAVGSFRETGNFRYITAETFQRLRCTEIRVGDILISRMPDPIGRAWLVDYLPSPAVTAVDVAILTPPTPATALYLSLWLNTPDALAHADAVATGTTRKRVSRSVLSRFKLIVPSQDRLDRFLDLVAPMCELASRLRRETTFLRNTRDLLLPRLISGEVRVPDLEVSTSGIGV
jgi:type I restriction enzyme S subunit